MTVKKIGILSFTPIWYVHMDSFVKLYVIGCYMFHFYFQV